MYGSRNTALAALLLLFAAGAVGCAAGAEDVANDAAVLAAAQAEDAPVNVTVNINQNGWNDDLGGGHHHHHHHGQGWGGHHGCGHEAPPGSDTPPPPPPDPPPSDPPPAPAR